MIAVRVAIGWFHAIQVADFFDERQANAQRARCVSSAHEAHEQLVCGALQSLPCIPDAEFPAFEGHEDMAAVVIVTNGVDQQV